MTHLLILVQWQNSAELSKKKKKKKAEKCFLKSLRNLWFSISENFTAQQLSHKKNLWGGLLLSIWQTLLDRHESETPQQIAFKVTHWIIHFLPAILYVG